MTEESTTRRRIAVIGGGTAGLTAAWRLTRDACNQVELFERSDRLGGVLRTERHGDYLVEHSADMFTTKDPWALELCRELGIDDRLVGADEARRRAFVVRDGELHQVPQGFVLMRPTQLRSMLSTPLLSWRGKLRMCCEPFIKTRRDPSDESLQSFVTRRLGHEVFQRIVQPLVGGIYTADPERLSMDATMPAFVAMERKHGSLIRAPHGKGEQSASGARYGAFVAPRDGMQAIPDALARQLEPTAAIRLNSDIRNLKPDGDGWSLELADGSERFDAVVIAAGATTAAKLLSQSLPDLSSEIASIELASAAVAVFGCDEKDIRKPVDGFGLVSPLLERRKILAVSFGSHKFPGRAPDGKVLIRVFMGGACQPEILENDDERLLQFAREELRELIGYEGEPDLSMLVHWKQAMPQYHLGHLDRVDRIESHLSEQPNLALAGNFLRGVGVPFCIRSGNEAAAKLS